MKKKLSLRISMLLIITMFVFGNGNAKTVEQMTVNLPLTLRNFCPPFVDDFSNPSSGWNIGEDEYANWEYLNGEYRILTKDDYFEYYGAYPPSCDRENYTVEVDARWVGEPGSSYGITFGIIGDFDQFYVWDVNTDYQQFGLWWFDGNDYHTLVQITDSKYINGGNATNHLKVTRLGKWIALDINGKELIRLIDDNITGETQVLFHSSPYIGYPISDARFDNFSIRTINQKPIPLSCPDFSDDFNDPASGWDIKENENVSFEYLEGEYRILSKHPHQNLPNSAIAPTCAHENYIVEVDVHWEAPGESFGILFGIVGELNQYYAFYLDTSQQVYGLGRFGILGFYYIVPSAYSPYINGGVNSSNHLKVTRNQDEITLEINGIELGTWVDDNIFWETSAGFFSVPNLSGFPVASDARFDNFSISQINSNEQYSSHRYKDVNPVFSPNSFTFGPNRKGSRFENKWLIR